MDRSITEEDREYWHLRMTSTEHASCSTPGWKGTDRTAQRAAHAILSGEVDALQVVAQPDSEPSPAGEQESQPHGANGAMPRHPDGSLRFICRPQPGAVRPVRSPTWR
jgi:hypothetical protein